MLILGVDTSGKNGSIALVDCEVEVSRTLEVIPLKGGTFSAHLIPQIAALLRNRGMTKHQIDAFVVVSGPGSFTGLRVGLAAIKALAEILKKPIAAVSMLEVMTSSVAPPLDGYGPTCLVAMDAGRGEAFIAEYGIGGALPRLIDCGLLTHGELAKRVEDLGKTKVILTPDKTLLELTLTHAGEPFLGNVKLVDRPDAATIARFGWKKIVAGSTVSPEALDATYIRRSEAEIKFDERAF